MAKADDLLRAARDSIIDASPEELADAIDHAGLDGDELARRGRAAVAKGVAEADATPAERIVREVLNRYDRKHVYTLSIASAIRFDIARAALREAANTAEDFDVTGKGAHATREGIRAALEAMADE